jgi:hypothetical protein
MNYSSAVGRDRTSPTLGHCIDGYLAGCSFKEHTGKHLVVCFLISVFDRTGSTANYVQSKQISYDDYE